MMRNVRRFYACSTAHLPEQTVQAIEHGLFAKPPSMQNESGEMVDLYIPRKCS